MVRQTRHKTGRAMSKSDKIKIVIIAAVTAAVGFVMSRAMIAVAAQANLYDALWLLGASVFFLTLLSLQAVAIASRKILAFALVAESLVVVVSFMGEASFVGVVISVMAAIVFIASGLRGQKDAQASVKIYFGKIIRVVAPLAVTAIALLFSYAYTMNVVSPDLNISEKGFNALLSPLGSALRKFIPEFELTMTFNKLMEAVILSDLPQLPAELRAAPREAKLQLLNESRGEVLRFVSEKLGVTARGADQVSEVLYRAANNKLSVIPEKWRQILPVGFGVLVFLTVRGLAFIINYLTMLLGWLLYRLLLAVGFFHVVSEQASKESVVL